MSLSQGGQAKRLTPFVDCRSVFFRRKPCPYFGWVPPAAVFFLRQENREEAASRGGADRCFLPPQSRLNPPSCGASWREKKLPAGGTQPMNGQGYRLNVIRFRTVNCLAIPQITLYRPSSVPPAAGHLPRRGRLFYIAFRWFSCRRSGRKVAWRVPFSWVTRTWTGFRSAQAGSASAFSFQSL